MGKAPDKSRSDSFQDEYFSFLQNVTTGPGSQVLFLGVRWLGHEADHSPTPSNELKNEWSCTSTPVCLHGIKRDNFTFTLDFLMCVICGNEDRKNTDDEKLYKKPGFWVHIQPHRCHFAIIFVLIIVLL
jgi:hypothetical protein